MSRLQSRLCAEPEVPALHTGLSPALVPARLCEATTSVGKGPDLCDPIPHRVTGSVAPGSAALALGNARPRSRTPRSAGQDTGSRQHGQRATRQRSAPPALQQSQQAQLIGAQGN